MWSLITYVILANITCYIGSKDLNIAFGGASFLIILMIVMCNILGYLERVFLIIGIINTSYIFFLVMYFLVKLYLNKNK